MVSELTIRSAFKKWESELATQTGSKPSADADKVRLWRELLGDVTEDQFKAAAVTVVRKLKFFPKPCEVLDLIQGNFEDACELAWQNVRDAIRQIGTQSSWFPSDLRGDRAALHAVESIGLDVMGAMTDDNRAIVRKQFERAYHLATERGLYVDHIIGTFERQNRCLGIPMARASLFGRTAEGCPELEGILNASALGAGGSTELAKAS